MGNRPHQQGSLKYLDGQVVHKLQLPRSIGFRFATLQQCVLSRKPLALPLTTSTRQ